ncbi:hypothetical protein AX15_004914 [Amanita polypyramis BW_CC]|nr:hypothetical protein AX15_004914 [Amanita polypyramis BW_CC]
MGWLSSLFSTHRQRRRALSATHDAFELPTSFPAPPSYTYPPAALPTHLDHLHSPTYPSLQSTWDRLRTWLDREYPELGDTLNYGIPPEDLAQIELQLGSPLPPAVRESYFCVDGQEAESAAGCSEGLFFGLTLLPLEDVLEEWRFWREVDEDPQTGANQKLKEHMYSVPPGWVRREYSQRGWIPLIADKVGNYTGVDLNPDQAGCIGQVIVFGRDFDTKIVLYPGDGPAGWAKWLATFVDELESGEGYELGRAENSDDDEDDLGYENYFYDGSGRGQGDGGGDNGASGGLRLTGEYKGWNVMEAWADRSMRKWREAGIFSSPSFEKKGKEQDTVGLSVVEQDSGVQIPIPVLADVDEPTPPPIGSPPLRNVTNIERRKSARESVSKPPVPMPVDLPTPHDIMQTPSPPPLDTEDLELGQRQGTSEVYSDNAGVLSAHSEAGGDEEEGGRSRRASLSAMPSLLRILLRPLVPLSVADGHNGTGLDAAFFLTVFCAAGIWLVYQRYHRMHNSPVPFEHPIPKAADPDYEAVPIENAHLESHLHVEEIRPPLNVDGRRYITSFDPATSLHIGTFIADDEREIQGKIRRAGQAQKKWRNTTFTQRRRVVRSLLKWLVDNQEICARVACRDTGKTLIDASLGEILTTCSKMEWLINHGEQVLRPETRANPFMLLYKKCQVHFEPLGVVAAIVSWNYPLHNAWSPILAAIFAGNGIVLKCSEHVIWSTGWFVDAIKECLKVCGHDPELVQVVCCFPDQAQALIKSPTIKHITFIGSEHVGRIIAAQAVENLTPVTLELGGKDPAIILPGTEISKWISVWTRGVFQNMGQNCIGIERLIVHADLYDELHSLLTERVKKMRPGSVLAQSPEGYVATVECGSMISGDRFESLEKLIKDAEEAGANVEGGGVYKHHYLENGYYFTPTVVGPVDPDMEIAQQELFAPIALLMPYETVEEAIEIANGTKYGLGASVFGPDQDLCLKVAKELECGMVSVNDFGVFYVNQDMPFGGTKNSGYGRFGGPEGLRSLTNPKAIVLDRFPTLVQTSIPKVLDYPLGSLSHSWNFLSNLIRFLYADGWRTRLRGLTALSRAANK